MKEKLMQTAMNLWQEYGYANISINRISKECGVTKGSFYHHFSSKEEVVDYYIQKQLEDVPMQDNQNSSYMDIIFSILKKMTEPLMDLNEDLIFIAMRQRHEGSSENDYNDVFMDSKIYIKLKEYCMEGQKNNEIRNDVSAEELLKACVSVFTGNMVKWCLNQKSFDLLKEDREIMELIMKR